MQNMHYNMHKKFQKYARKYAKNPKYPRKYSRKIQFIPRNFIFFSSKTFKHLFSLRLLPVYMNCYPNWVFLLCWTFCDEAFWQCDILGWDIFESRPV